MKMIPIVSSLCAAAAFAAMASASAQSLPVAGAQGQLVSDHGLTLYSYDPDGRSGQSQCSGPCAALWPPYTAAADAKAAGDFSVIARADHSRQWAWQGRPLYRYAGDPKPDDIHGEGLNGIWHTVHPR